MPPKSNPPTERQLKYAADLGILVPANADIKDVSDLISAAVDNDKPSTLRHRAFAEYFGIKTTEYIGKKSLFNLIQSTLANGGRDRDLMSWFTYRVYRNLTNAADNTPINGPGDADIQAIAATLASNAKIVKSARRYEGKELIYFGEWTAPDGFVYSGGSKNTAAYKAAEASLKQIIRLPKKQPEPKATVPVPRNQAAIPVLRIQAAKPIRKRKGLLRTAIRLIIWGVLFFIILPTFLFVFISLYRD